MLKLSDISDSFLLICIVIGLWSGPVCAVSAEVVIIKSHDLTPYNDAVAGFRSVTRTHVTEYSLLGDRDEGVNIIHQLRKKKPDIILAVGVQAALLAQENLSDIPMVYSVVLAPEKHGLTTGNAIGISMGVPVGEQFKLFKETLPSLRTLGVIFDPANSMSMIRMAREEAGRLGIDLVAIEVHRPQDVPAAVRRLLPQIHGLWMIPDSTVVNADSIQFFLLTTLQEGIPLMTFSPAFVKSGGLLSLSIDYQMIGRQSSTLVDQILKNPGGTPHGVPHGVVRPQVSRISLNLRTAKSIGIEIPKAILNRADEVFR